MSRRERFHRIVALIWISLTAYYFLFVIAVAISKIISQRSERPGPRSPIEAGIRDACESDNAMFVFQCDRVLENVLALLIAVGILISIIIYCAHVVNEKSARSE